jgi:myo-inositol-1(or 4)-monophosphatase
MTTLLDALTRIVKIAAREELLPRFAESERRFKRDGSIVTDADIAMQRRLVGELEALAPDYRLLGEEMSEQDQGELILAGDRGLWCLDPLDGTSNFASGIPFFSVSLGLLIDRQPTLGVVYDPIRDECFTAAKGKGAKLNDQPLRCRPVGLPLRRSMAVVDFKRIPELAAALAASPPYSSQRNFGSVALEWCWLAANRFQVYLHGRQKLWDYAAGALILTEAGGCAETLEGEPIFAPALQSRSAVAAADANLFAEWQAWLANARASSDPR